MYPDEDDAAQDAALAETVLAHDLSELERTVAVMRRLGVARWRDVVLGPEPQAFTPRTEPAVAEAKRAQRVAEERHRTLFASSRVVPPLPGKPSNLEAHAAARKVT